eukprot:CAMPEP_0168611786 /NCGR_PEP_ID=MMETSP0449_2-20121227/2548_1 /TAXON_ID=1082188 /ORGANISM="Strombidium rassoulzadegani, Strain ras09" /LENGTH=59 /DNA_ID=CAMNT_0008652265 /DNA_START=975 /DNA_END=1154 /DNA_ORIENTATION=-
MVENQQQEYVDEKTGQIFIMRKVTQGKKKRGSGVKLPQNTLRRSGTASQVGFSTSKTMY